MATNPNRPQYQDTIESTWGQSVADHVIRRYGTAAERDADLAALTPADLEGQVVAIGAGAGVPYLEQYRGGGWWGVGEFRAGMAWVTVQGASNFGVSYPPLPGTPQVRMAAPGPGMPSGLTCSPTDTAAPGSCEFQAWNASGGVEGAGAVLQIMFIVAWNPDPPAGATSRPGPDLESEAE